LSAYVNQAPRSSIYDVVCTLRNAMWSDVLPTVYAEKTTQENKQIKE